jgi:hypothetical protein
MLSPVLKNTWTVGGTQVCGHQRRRGCCDGMGDGGNCGDVATGPIPNCQLAQNLQGTACPPCMHAYTPFITQRTTGNALRVTWHGRGG